MTDHQTAHDWFTCVSAAARRLHDAHGRGDIIGGVRVFADGRVEVDAKPYGCRCRTYTGWLVNRGRSVRLHRHQTLIESRQP